MFKYQIFLQFLNAIFSLKIVANTPLTNLYLIETQENVVNRD